MGIKIGMGTIEDIIKASEQLAGSVLDNNAEKDGELAKLEDKSTFFREVIASYGDPVTVKKKLDDMDDYDCGKALASVKLRIEDSRMHRFSFRILRTGIAAAAIAAVLIYVFAYRGTTGREQFMELSGGTINAVFYTSHGDVINIGESEASLSVDEILAMSRQFLPDHTDDDITRIGINRITVPYGGYCNFSLPDGTHVWLNSGAEISFPQRFGSKLREVQIKGEAFFDVTHDPDKPFVVNMSMLNIKVLGTRFNTRDYQKADSEVTLESGSLEVRNRFGDFIALLRPDQRLSIKEDGSVAIQEINAKSVSAWKEGLFLFDNQTLEYIMSELSRWYNISVHFDQEDLKNLCYYINVPRTNNAYKIFDIIRSTNEVDLVIEKKTVTVRPVK